MLNKGGSIIMELIFKPSHKDQIKTGLIPSILVIFICSSSIFKFKKFGVKPTCNTFPSLSLIKGLTFFEILEISQLSS